MGRLTGNYLSWEYWRSKAGPKTCPGTHQQGEEKTRLKKMRRVTEHNEGKIKGVEGGG